MLSRRVRWGVFIMLVKSSGKKKKKWKKIYHKSQSTNQFLSNRTTKWCPSKTGHAWSCAVLEIWKGSAHVSEPDHVFSLTKLSFSKWPNWPSPSTEPLRGVVLEVPRGCCCTAEFSSLALEPWSPDGAFKNARCWFLENGHRTVQSEWSWCHLGTTLVFSLFGSWFLGSFWCLCTHVMF